jgi:hypothetical protein
MADMTDEDLVGYIALHCKTERALTHSKHIKQLLRLAGKPEDSFGDIDGFYCFPSETAMPLVKWARERLKHPGQEEMFIDFDGV